MTQVFSGVRIVELAQYVFAPAAAVLLADQGAEVIKVEGADTGDPYRTLTVGDGRETQSANLSMEQNNRGKKSIALNLKSREGREALLRLIETADVFLTSLRPRALRSLRLDVEDLRARNPKIIYARGNGLGFGGPEAEKAGYDACAFWARGGFAHLLTPAEAHMPIRSRPALGDHASAVSLAMGIAGALFRRERTGEPSVVETSLLSNAVWMLSSDIVVSQSMENYEAHVRGQQEKRFPLMRPYATNDGRWIQLMLLAPDKYWPELCQLIDMPDAQDDPRFATAAARLVHGDALIEIIAERIGRRSWGEWAPLFEAWNAPWDLVKTIGEVAEDVQVQDNGLLFEVEVANGAKVRVVAGPVSYDGQASPDEPRASPGLGAHTDEVLSALGYQPSELATLREAAVIR